MPEHIEGPTKYRCNGCRTVYDTEGEAKKCEGQDMPQAVELPMMFGGHRSFQGEVVIVDGVSGRFGQGHEPIYSALIIFKDNSRRVSAWKIDYEEGAHYMRVENNTYLREARRELSPSEIETACLGNPLIEKAWGKAKGTLKTQV